MAQNIEIPVSLGLQNAYSQAADLRKILQESVNVKSDAFRDIQRLLDKITNQADGLKGKMSEAFKTPSGSKSFLKQYEQLFSLIDIAKEKMTSLKLEDISFSGADLDQVKAYQSELQTLRQEIDTLSKGKIGNIFEGDTIANAEKVRDMIEHLHLDPSKLTFSGLSAAIGKELDGVNDLLAKSQSKLDEYKNSIQALDGAGYTNLQQKIQEAISGAIDSSKFTFKTENLVKYSEALEQFYHNFNQLKIDKAQAGQIVGGGKISEFIDQEGIAIKTAADKMKEQIQSYAQALNKLEELKNAPIKKGVIKKDEAQKIADELGLAFDTNAKTEVAINNLQERIREAWDKTGFNNFSEINEYADKMLKALGESFDKADLNQYINTKQLSNQLKNIFTEAGIDLKDTNISAIFNSMSSNMDVGTFFQEAIQHMEAYRAAKESLVQSEQASNDTLKAAQENLQAADQAATAGQNSSNVVLEEKRDRVEMVIEALQRLAQAMNDSNRAKMNPDTSGLETGRNAINSYIASITKLQQKQKALGNIQMAVNRWMGFWQVLNMTKKAINDMKQHLQELDSVMTQISVVTNFSQSDLWGQISQYSEIARSYGVAIKGVYEVSQIYYQQGLQQNDVMTLTTETLKMARIAGLDYATAADYMTTAIRGFKLEMTDAAHVTDVFSALAATTASSTEEIATAISKTAASAQAVGASFEATSAMMATMIATTRESATNIGTALKSVISRYGEMTSDPSKTVDSEGEEMSLNRVDKALQTVGITIHDTTGQFRDFDDVMLELMEKWDSLDSLSQRYIATLMAGNRQQSRFLALVSNVDEYKKALETATNAEGTGELQTLKTLDSIDAKIEKMKVTIQEFYTSSGIETLYKGILDTITNVISAANDMPKIFGKIPVQALAVAGSLIAVIKNALKTIIINIQASLKQASTEAAASTESTGSQMAAVLTAKGAEAGQGFWQRFTGAGSGKVLMAKIGSVIGQAVSIAGSGLIISGANQYGESTSRNQDITAGLTTSGGWLTSIAGSAITSASLGAMTGGLHGALIGTGVGVLQGFLTNIPSLMTAIQQLVGSTERTVKLAQKNAEVQKTEAERAQGEFKSLDSAINKFKQLEAAQYNSAEAAQNFKDYVNQLADSYPSLISQLEISGDYNIELASLEEALAAAREKTAIATANATKAELDSQKTTADAFEQASDVKSTYENIKLFSGWQDYQDQVYSFDDMWDELDLDDTLPEYLKKREDENSADAIKRIYNLLNPDNQVEELNFNSDAEKIFNSLLTFQRYGSQGYSQTDLDSLKKQVESMIKIDSTLSIQELTGFDKLDNLTPIEILQAFQKFQKVTQEYADHHNQTAETLTQRLVADEANIAIAEEASNNIDNSFDYDIHGKLISSLVAQNEWGQKLAELDTDESQLFEEYTKQKVQDYLKYFENREDGLKFLENDLQLEDFSTEAELIKVLETEGQLDSNDANGREIQLLYVKKWHEQREKIIDLYNNQLLNIFGDKNLIPSFLNNSKKFTGTTITAIQSDLKKYQSLIENQQYAQAEAYLNSMEAIYGQEGIGGLSSENQTKAFAIIKDLDLADSTALRSAAETFAGMGSEFSGVSQQFTDAAMHWATNGALLIEQLNSSAQETAKSIESSTSDMSKVFKYSEALEKAQALIDANEGVKFGELFTYDKDLGGYVKTAKAYQLEMAEFQQQQYESIDQSITDYGKIGELRATYSKGLGERYSKSKTLATPEAVQNRQNNLKARFGKTLGLDAEKNSAELDRLWQEYTAMVDAYEEQLKTNEDLSWEDFTAEYLNNHTTALKDSLNKIKEMPQQMAREALQSFDYKSIVSGKGTTQNKETLKALLMSAAPQYAAHIDHFFADYYQKLITGNIEEYNTYLERLGLSEFKVTEGEANRARFEAFYDAYQKIAGDESPLWNALDSETQKFLTETAGITEADYTSDPAAAAQNLWAVIIEFIDNGVATMNEVAESISALSDKAYGSTSKEKSYQLLDKYKDGLTSEELGALQGENNGLLIDKSTGLLSNKAAKYLTYDNGKFVAKAGQDAASVLAFLASTLGFAISKNTDEYKDAIKTATDEQIANNEANNTDKQFRSVLKNIFSGQEGDEINIAGISSTARKRLTRAGYSISGNILTIGTEQAMNNAAIALEQQAKDGDWFWKKNSLSANDVSTQIRQLQASMAKNAAFEGIIGEQFNQSAAEALSMALQNTTEYSKVQSLMTEMGFKWDQAAQVWKASAESIKAAKSKITQAFSANEIDAETYTSLIASLNETANAINPKTKQDNTILDMLQNYTNATEAIKAAFITNFDPSIYTYNINKLFKVNDNGTYDVDVSYLQSFLSSIGYEYDNAAKDVIASIHDTILSGIGQAAGYAVSGTFSEADMQAFVDSYNDLIEGANLDINSAFQYDKVNDSFIANSEVLSRYMAAVRDQLASLNYTEDFINEYINGIYQKDFDISGLLSSTGPEYTRSRQKLAAQIKSWRNSLGDNISDAAIEVIINTIEAGGDVGVKTLENLIGKDNVTSELQEQVYNAAINRLTDVASQVSDLVAGQFVGTEGKLYEILRTAGAIDAEADGVIAKGFSMVAVYRTIYTEMSNTEGATIAGLNDAYAKLLTAHDQVNIDITDTLRNGAGMSYADFGNLLAKYDIKFEEYLTDHWDTIILDGFGNVRIANWDAFAKDIWGDRLDQVKNTPEYTNAFKAYNDGLIELNQNVEKNIKDEILQISAAKAGDQLNFSYLWTALQNAINDNKVDKKDINDQLKALQAVGASYVDGILTISEDANILIISDILKTLSELSGMDLGEDGQAAIRDAVDDLLKNIASLISNGAKGSLTNADATSLSQWYRSNAKNYPGATITELDFTKTAEGLQLTETSLANVYDLMKRIDAIQAGALLDDIISSRESFQSLTGALREFNDAMRLDGIDDATNKLKNFNGTLSNTAQMMQDVVQKAMTSPDSMNFMSNKLPDDMQTAVNAWENASQAIKTLTASQKSGYMGVQDFYNIVNTASSLMVAAGKEFEVAGMDAATLLQKGAENVKIVDGKLTVDISSAGLDIQGSVGDLKKNLTTGINELASAEIAIIDAEIQVLEILAAMEQMGDMVVDIDNDGLSFEISDIFDDQGNFTEGENSMKAYLEKLQKIVGTEGEIADAFRNFKIGTTSLYDLIHGTADEWVKVFGSQENVAKFMQKFSKGIEGWDLEGNLEQQVLEFMKGLGQDYSIDLGDSGVFHVNASGVSYVIDFNDKERISAAQEAAKSVGLNIGKTDEEFKSYLKELVERGNTKDGKTSELTFKENFVLKVATGQIEVVEDKNTKTKQYKVSGKLYNNQSVANAVAELIQAGAKTDWEKLQQRETDLGETETIKGTMSVGKAEIEVTSDGKGNVTYQTPGGKYKGSSLDELYTDWFERETGKNREENGLEFKKWQVKQGISVETVIDINGKEGNAKTNKDVRAAIQKVIDEGLPDGKIDYGGENSKSIEVDIGGGVKLTIPKEKLEFENGEVIPESLQEYLRDNYNTIDLDLKDTISKAITEAFTELSSILSTLDTSKVSELGTAFATVYTNVQAVAQGINALSEALTALTGIDLKINIELPDLPIPGEGGEGGLTGEQSQVNIPVGGEATGTTAEAVKEEMGNAEAAINDAAPEINNAVIKAIGETGGVKDATGAMAKVIPDTFKTTLGIASPSTVMIEQAKFIGEGIEQGLNESTPIVEAAAEELGNVIITKIEETVIKVQESIAKITEAVEQLKNTKLDIDVDTILNKIQQVQMAIDKLSESRVKIQVDTSAAEGQLEALKNKFSIIDTTQQINTVGGVTDIADFTTVQTIITRGGGGSYNHNTLSGQPQVSDGYGYMDATGNIGLAKAKGTLMGELGPELVVSNGRYFVAGQNGAEMVNLADDAIVFNHLQTEQLLKNGMSSGRGRAVTNERNAVAFATGNINGGPAMASASAALAALKQLRAMWESLRSAKVSDLAGAGGGGGGGGGTQNKIVDPKAWVDTVERWYNLTQEIARLEEEITHQQTIRTKLQSDWQKNGNAYYRSQKKSLDALNQQIAAQEQLNISRREYFNKRVEALKNEALGQIYTFDKEGQLQFRKDITINGKQGGMEFLTDLYGFNNLGKANYTNKEKYEILMASGFADYMKYDSNGMEIKVGGEGKEEDYETFYEQATQAFRDRLDQYNDATQSLLDEINKGEDDIEKLETDRNELMKEIRDNQMELENEILDAIVESRQRQIDALQDQRDALEETTGKYIEGLSDALEKERNMYERQESQDELNRNKRRLAILQRSGGSAADISNLQSDISSQERDLYFNSQQAQIDAIQEASDLEIERLDKQIELMTETLEFQQEYGLLWGEVYEIMDRSSQEIVDFINGNSAEFWKMSTLAQVQAMNDETFKAEYWTSYKDDLDTLATETREQQLARDYATFDERMKAEYGNNYDANGRYRQAFEDEYRQGWNIDEATKVARQLYHDEVIKPQDEARRAAERAAAEVAAQAAVEQAASGGGGGSGNNNSRGSSSGTRLQGRNIEDYLYKVGSDGLTDSERDRNQTEAAQELKDTSRDAQIAAEKAKAQRIKEELQQLTNMIQRIRRVTGMKQANGGYVGHGIYELGEQGTETVLTASQTRVLRNNILSNRPNSLISLLKTYNEGFNQNKLAQATTVLQKENENPSIFIENVSVNMNVQQMSNDYDARRAGQEMMNEVMRIARKSGATNSVRR